MTTIHFNTGRQYTTNGQRITATLHSDGVVTFFDHDRGVDGEFELFGVVFTQAVVMRVYDNDRAPSTRRSWADGMLRGGCNATFKQES